MRIIELFAGIGACSKALKRIGVDLEIIDAVEIDKYAMASFNAIHGTNFKTQDITEWNKDFKDIDLITHGSPCQDFSVAGKQAGGDIDSGTRSSLMYETIRIVGKIRPKYVLWENVKNLLSKKHKHNFDAYIETMNVLGYNSYYQVLNAKDYGIPQNRERVYTISIRKDIDKGNFKFPEKEELKLRLKDMLEDEVDEKYYLSNKMIDYILKPGTKNYKKEPELNNEIAKPLLATMTKMHRAGIDNYIAEPKCVQVGNLYGGKWDKINESCRRVYGEEGISPTIHTCQGGNTEPKIIKYDIFQTVKVRKYPVDIEKLKETLRNAKIEQDITNSRIAFKLDVPITTVEHWFRKDNCFAIPDEDVWFDLKHLLNITTNEFDKSIMTFEEKDGIYDKANRIYDKEGLAPTLTQQEEKIIEPQIQVIGNYMPSNHNASRIVDNNGLAPTVKENHGTITATNINYRIRKLTPKECWRLMGFSDEDFEKVANIPTSNTQLYKQAGNSIVVNVLEKIFKNLFNI